MSLLTKKSSGSAAGPDGIQYKVFKLFPCAARFLYAICKRCHAARQLPASWSHAFFILLSKPGKPTDHPKHLRNIACASSGGKMFWTCLLEPLTSFLVDNKYIDTEVQKAVPGIPGCLEHSWATFEALKDAKLNKRQICVAMTDLKDAYGSVKHNLLQFAMKWYRIPDWYATLAFHYYENLVAFVKTNEWQTNPFRYGIGFFQGCVKSMSWFTLVYQIVIDYLHAHGIQPYIHKVSKVPMLQKAFVDDHSLYNCSPIGAQFNLNKLSVIIAWTRCLSFNLTKCIAWAMGDLRTQGGKSYGPFDPKLTFDGKNFKYLADELFKFLGRLISIQASNQGAYNLVVKDFLAALHKVDSIPLNGPSKVWIYEFYINAKILSWPFLIYPFSVSSIQKDLEAPATRFLKKWFGLSKPANPAILFLPKSQHGLGLTSPVDKFKSLQVSAAHQLLSSSDPSIITLANSASSRTASNRWSPFDALNQAQAIVEFNSMFQGQIGSSGLGFGKRQNKPLSRIDRRSLLVSSVKANVAEARTDMLRKTPMSANFLRWTNLVPATTNLNYQILNMSEAELSFVLNAQAQSLPDPSNLRRWGCNVNARCLVCGKPNSTAKHVTNGCSTALKQGRYTWRHDNLLCLLIPVITDLVATANRSKPSAPERIRFLAEGVNPKNLNWNNRPGIWSLLSSANDWRFLVDLKDNPLMFPPITGITTNLRPDIVIWSVAIKTIIWGELSCPLEELILEAHIRKFQRYLSLEIALIVKGWRVHAFPFEVGSLGFVGHSSKKFLSAIGLRGPRQRTVIQDLSSVARKSSFHIWQSRRSPTWVCPPLLPVRLTSDSVTCPASLQALVIAKKREDALARRAATRTRSSQLPPMASPLFPSPPPFHLLTPTIQARILTNKANALQRLKKSRSVPSPSSSVAPPISSSPSADRCISNLSLTGRSIEEINRLWNEDMARKAKLSADEDLENRFKLLLDGDPISVLPLPDISHLGVDLRRWEDLYEGGIPTSRQLSQLAETVATSAADAAADGTATAAAPAAAAATVATANSSQQRTISVLDYNDDLTLFL